ncbi:MAG: zinc ABC transporter substrate-binding protein [Gammaproteobacteria bacterium]|nr:MAG: zinc ABC transporter substrate-binding protein [Gammaproteobacteria bacterium]
MGRRIAALLVCLAAWLPVDSNANLEVFACEPEWAALVEEIGAQRVEVFSATTAQQDVHHIQARPGLIARVRRADLVVCTGAELEAGWLPVLLRRAGNPAVQPGTSGYFEAADHVTMLEKPASLDRAEGDVHARGNPHIHLDPRNIEHVASALGDRLAALDPAHATSYRAALADFERRWQAARARWEQQAQPLRGMPVVVHHPSWVYLNQWLGLRQVTSLEPKPGVAPTARQLAEILNLLHATPARVVIRTPYQDPRPSAWLHERAGLPVLELPFTVGGSQQASDLFGLFDSTIALLLEVQQ